MKIDILTTIKGSCFAAGLAIGSWLGGWDMALQLLVVFAILDQITGVAAAWYTKTPQSKTGRQGIATKVMMFVVVGLAHGMDCVLATETALRLATIMFYIANEGLSILENATEMNLPLPKQIKDILIKVKEENEEKKNV